MTPGNVQLSRRITDCLGGTNEQCPESPQAESPGLLDGMDAHAGQTRGRTQAVGSVG